MGKKKQFIDKKNASSFHIIHRTSAPDSASAAASSASSLSLSSAPSAVSPASAYYFQPSKADTAIPAGFPLDLLVAQNEAQDRAAQRLERRSALQRERDSRDPSLLPHEYDYSAHLKAMGGGLFISAAGAAAYDSAASKKERQQREHASQQDDARSQQPAVEDALDAEVDWAMVRRAEAEGKRKRRRTAGGVGTGSSETALSSLPVDVLLALEHDEQVAADGEEGAFEELEDDFVLQAMEGTGDAQDEAEESGGEEELSDELDAEDDMLARIRQYDMRGTAVDGEEEEEEEEEQDEWKDEEDEEELKSDDDEKGAHAQTGLKTGRAATALSEKKTKEARVGAGDKTGQTNGGQQREDGESLSDEGDEEEFDSEYENEQEDELRPLPSRALDADFDRLLAEQYGEDDIGGLDAVDEALVSGALSIDSFADSLDAFLSRQSLPVSKGGSDLSLPSAERDTVKRRMMRRLRAMAVEAEEGREPPIEQWMSEVYKEVVEDEWDVESIVSTYSNTENHPTAIREKRSQAATQQAAKRREQAQTALAQAIADAAQPTQQHGADAEEDEEDEADRDAGATRNLGEARPRGESAEEKRARKAAMKAEKREGRQRKKQLRTLYASLEHTQHMQHAKASVDMPVGRQLL